MSDEPTRKTIRLSPEHYQGNRWYFVTVCCERRRTHFAEPSKAEWLIEVLRQSAAISHFTVHAYCVMPDHLHFLVFGCSETSDLVDFVRRFKQKTAHGARVRFGVKNLWQRFFYDHILRTSEAVDSVAWYIWMNPVRKGFCREPTDYSFSGPFAAARTTKEPEKLWTPPWKSSASERAS